MNYKCEMMNAKLNRIFQFPVEIFFCIIVVLSHFFPDCSFLWGKGDYGNSWFLFSCELAYTVRTAEYFKNQRLYWYVSVGILCPILFALCSHNIFNIDPTLLPALGFACVLSSCERDNFFISYRKLTNNIIKTYACWIIIGFAIIVAIDPFDIPKIFTSYCIIVLLFCYFQTEKENSSNSRFDYIYIINILISVIALVGLLWLVIDEANNLENQIRWRRYTYLDDTVILFVVSLHCLLISTPYKKKIFKFTTQIANLIAIIVLAYISIFLINRHEINLDYIYRILLSCAMLLAHFFIFIKPNRDVRKSFLVSIFAIVSALIISSVCYGFYINIYKEKVKAFAEKYELIRHSIIRNERIPIEALKDPDFQEFMENRKKLISLGCFIYESDPKIIKTKYSVTADSVIIEKVDGERTSYSIEEYNAE